MIIKLNGTAITGKGELAPDDLRINGTRVVQVQKLFRATAARARNRGNLLTTVTFGLAREHASLKAAEYFLLTHYLSLPTAGTAEFIAYDANGTEAHGWLPYSALEVSDHNMQGVTTFHRYAIKGGLMQTTAPTS